MVVTKSDDKTEYAATVFLKWFTEAERNIQFSLESGYLPVKTEANHLDAMLPVADKLTDVKGIDKIIESLPVALQTVNDYTLYTNKAFNGGTAARAVLENNLSSQVSSDLEKINALVAKGTSRAQAVATFTTDENFNSWYDAFVQALEASIK